MPEESERPEASNQSEPFDLRPDYFLQNLVDLVHRNRGNITFPITLFVGGIVISGQMIDGETYYNLFAENFDKMTSRSIQNWEDVVSEFKEWGKPFTSYGTDEEHKTHELTYIFLRDATFLSGTRVVPMQGGLLWRGRLSSVDGFSFALMAEKESP
jgi:hypothetical protein